MNKRLVIRNLLLAGVLLLLSGGVTLVFLLYIQFFQNLPR